MLHLHIVKALGNFALDVAIDAGPGVTALFGPSGSGKTSVIQAVAGLMRPDRGRIAADGRVLFDSGRGIDLPPESRRLGYVFQEGRLLPHLTVAGNLRFGMNRVPAPERRVDFDDVVGMLGIGHLLDRRPRHLSGGEKQRVAIGRALLASPLILLMDEPLAALDEARKAEVLPFLGQLVKRYPIPIVYVSHSMDEVLLLADHLVLMDLGRVAASGTVEDLLARPDLRAYTGISSAGAVLSATVNRHDQQTHATLLDFPGGRLVIGQVDLVPGTVTRLRILARDIALSLDPPGRISMRNVLKATITAIQLAEGHLVDVSLDCGGCRLWAQISRQALAELALTPGMPVWAMVKAVTVARDSVAEHRRMSVPPAG